MSIPKINKNKALTVTLENARQLSVGPTGENGLAKSLLDDLRVIDDDHPLRAKVDLVDGAVLDGKAGQRQVEILADEGKKAKDRDAQRTGRQWQRTRPGQVQLYEEKDENGDEEDAEE